MIFSPTLTWFLVGVTFLIAELAMPGFILIFFAAGSWVTALTVWLVDMDLTQQILVFTLSSLVLLFALRKYGLKTFKGNTAQDIDDDYRDSKIGKTAVVTQTIAPHRAGEIKVMGSFWRAIADTEIETGRSVTIESQTSEDGLTFKVKPL